MVEVVIVAAAAAADATAAPAVVATTMTKTTTVAAAGVDSKTCSQHMGDFQDWLRAQNTQERTEMRSS